ncbi:MAG: DUF4127 family protein [Clostridia bacterium]|nr:DUF4127 family protein [Clostridia bacterium]
MKKILCVLLSLLLSTAVLPACAASGGDSAPYLAIDGYLYNVLEKTSRSDFEKTGYKLDFSDNEYVATGDIATDKNGKRLTVVIYGDADGDGETTVYDYLLVRRLYMGTVKLAPVFELACRMEETVTPYDYILVRRHYHGTYVIGTVPHRTPDQIPEIEGNGIKIAYIPLDNRPVNKDRVEYLAASAGFELLIPEEDLYRTALDNMTPNSDGSTIGNRKALLDWLKSVENECDYFVISLDQLISGGLVGSRYLSNTDLTFEMEVSDYIVKLAANKHVVLFDTVMRLASTVGYQGYDLDTYNILRSYGQKARKQLSGSELTVENIVAGYRYDKNGREISVNLPKEVVDRYFASRERKLRVMDYLLTNASETIERIYVGVDDSSPEITVQTNEINYITAKGGDNLTLFAGADELGLMGIAAVATDVYGTAECKVTYFGEGKDWAADGFDTATLASNIENHFNSIGATMNSENENALQVLVLTRSNSVATNADKLMKQAVENIEKGIPTCIIDASDNNSTLPQKMLDYKYDIAKLLGYSNWNTVGNAIGIALSNAVARYIYITRSDVVTKESNEAFLKTLTFSLIKDISYKRKGISNLSDKSAYGPATIISRINSSQILVKDLKSEAHGKVSVSNFRYPWNRSFEATFDITVK